jgi:hypothetical protein
MEPELKVKYPEIEPIEKLKKMYAKKADEAARAEIDVMMDNWTGRDFTEAMLRKKILWRAANAKRRFNAIADSILP